MGLLTTLLFVPQDVDSPVPDGGRGGSAEWLIAPEYDGLGPFWFAPDEDLDPATAAAVMIPVGDVWYFHEQPDYTDDLSRNDWAKRVRHIREALAPTCIERTLRSKL